MMPEHTHSDAAVLNAFGAAVRKLISACEDPVKNANLTHIEAVGLYGALEAAYGHGFFNSEDWTAN